MNVRSMVVSMKWCYPQYEALQPMHEARVGLYHHYRQGIAIVEYCECAYPLPDSPNITFNRGNESERLLPCLTLVM